MQGKREYEREKERESMREKRESAREERASESARQRIWYPCLVSKAWWNVATLYQIFLKHLSKYGKLLYSISYHIPLNKESEM